MALTSGQKVALKAALAAETDAGVVAALAGRNDVFLHQWCNGVSGTDAWRAAAGVAELFDAINLTRFDALTDRKSAAWVELRVYASVKPINFGQNTKRNAIIDIWGVTDGAVVLSKLLEKARRVEVYLGGTSRTTEGVTGLDRDFYGQVTLNEVSEALNLL
jgi:hypothetical protein